jgi:hypothetical protein
VLGPSAAFYLAAIVFLTQFVKEALKLSGLWVRLVAILLGVLMALGGLQERSALLFPGFTPPFGAVLVGVLLGVTALGGYQTVTWLQDRNAAVQARASAAAPAVPALPALPPEAPDLAPGFVPAPEDTATPGLPRTMAVLPD